MAKHVLIDAYVSVNGVVLSDHTATVQFVTGIRPVPAAAMSELQDYDMPSTIFVSPISVRFFQDYAASSVYATIQPLVVNRSTVPLIVKPTSGADSATNPAFTINVFVASKPLISGARGDGHMIDVVFQPAGALTYDVT